MHLKCNKKVLLIECWKPGLDARSQFQTFAFLKSDMTSLDQEFGAFDFILS